MICPPCQAATDDAQRLRFPTVHDPALCRDHAVQPHGCGCQHGTPRPHAAPEADRA